MTIDSTQSTNDLNVEALEVFRSLVEGTDALPERWRSTMLALTKDGIPRELGDLERLIANKGESE